MKTLLSIPEVNNESHIPQTRTAWVSSCGARYAGPCRINEMELATVTRNKTLPTKYTVPLFPARTELLDCIRLFTHTLHITHVDDPDMIEDAVMMSESAANEIMIPDEAELRAIAEDLKELSNKNKLDIPIRVAQQNPMGPLAEMVCHTLSHCFGDLVVNGKLVVNSVKQRDHDSNEEEN